MDVNYKNSIIPEKLQKMMDITKKMHGGRENLINGVAELASVSSGIKPNIIFYSEYKPQVLLPQRTFVPLVCNNGYSAAIRTPYRYNTPAPENQDELLERFSVRHEALLKQSKLIKRIFRKRGRKPKDKTHYILGNIIVAIEGFYSKEVDSYIPPGGWVDLNSLQYGRDFIELYAVLRGCEYNKAIAIIAKCLKLDLTPLKYANNKKNWWVQVKDPLITHTFQNHLDSGCKLLNSYEYKNDIGEVIGYVYYVLLPNGETVQYFKTIWRHNQSEIPYWLDIDPEKPLMIYNEFIIAQNPGALICFSKNEMQAQELQAQNVPSEKVFTACPRGLQNLPYADLTLLRGRKVAVIIEENSPDIQVMPKFIEKGISAEISEILLTFDYGVSFISSHEFMKAPGKWGCNPEAENEKKSKILYKTVPSGEKADGEDMENAILLYPIIEEGNIIWIFGEAKSFKSWIGYKIACALSIGNQIVGKWKSGDAVKVLYIDGEMRPNKIKRRLDLIKKGMDYELEERPFDLYIVKDSSGANIGTDILSEEWQNNMASDLNRADVIVLDNFYSLTDNSQKSVKSAISWFTKLSQAGKTVIVLDHSNREGDVQGSISKERAADLVIKIEPDKDVKNKVKISLPKPRDLHPNDTESFELMMVFENGAFKMELVGEAEENDQPLSDRDLRIAVVHELTNARSVDREQILEMLQIKQATYYKYLKKELPILTEKQKIQVKSEADKLLQALTA